MCRLRVDAVLTAAALISNARLVAGNADHFPAFRSRGLMLMESDCLPYFCNTVIDLAEIVLKVHNGGMEVTLTVSDRGAITLPAKIRKEMGIEADSLLIAESTEDGILLRPAVAFPVEVYSRERLAEFAAAEEELAEWYGKKTTDQ